MRQTILTITLLMASASLAQGQAVLQKTGHGINLATHRCMGWQLSAKHESEDAGAGQRDVTYSFTNQGPAPCTLRGFPKFTLLNRWGHPMSGQSITHMSESVTTVTLAPSGKAFFNIHYSACSTVGTPPCRFSSRVRIKAPRTSHYFRIRDRLDPFQLSVQVSPVKSNAP